MKPAWNTPPTKLLLLKHDVHIWRAFLDLPSIRVQKLAEKLSADERTKSEHFRFERDRSHFITARGILRKILGCYLGVEPSAVRFFYENSGKPRLQNALDNADIHFNLSHSEGLALYVIARGHEVGIDIEYMREMPEMEQIIEQSFSKKDRILLGGLSESEKRDAFYKLWVRKEAFVKATGEGLSYPLDNCDASVAPGESSELSRIFGDARKSRWLVRDVRPAEEFAGAFAVEGERWEVQYWQWPS